MNGVAELLRHPALWRAGDAGAAGTVPTGFHALDARLPGGGWPLATLIELLVPAAGVGEVRLLLPALDSRYRAYSVRALRERVRDDIDAGKALSSRLDHLWRELQGVFLLIDKGDDAVGMPAYNGGLFDRSRAPLLERTCVPDAVMAPIIDALSRRTEQLHKLWINYRDLSVSHLGGIYERLLDQDLSVEPYAFALPRDEHDFRLAVNRVLAGLYRGGGIQPIYERWLGPMGAPSILLTVSYYLQAIPE